MGVLVPARQLAGRRRPRIFSAIMASGDNEQPLTVQDRLDYAQRRIQFAAVSHADFHHRHYRMIAACFFVLVSLHHVQTGCFCLLSYTSCFKYLYTQSEATLVCYRVVRATSRTRVLMLTCSSLLVRAL